MGTLLEKLTKVDFTNLEKILYPKNKITKTQKIKTFPNNIEIFGYFSKYFSGHPPTDAKKILKLLQNKNNSNS